MSVFRKIVPLGAIAVVGVGVTAMAPASAASTMRAVYHMEEAGTTLVDSSGYGHHGTLTNVTTGQPGVAGFAYKFNGKNSVATVPNAPTLNPGSDDFTVAASFKMKVRRAVDMDVVRKGLSTTNGGDYKLDLKGTSSNVQVRCAVIGKRGRVAIRGGANVNDNAWHRVSCTKKSNKVVLVLDGKIIAQQRLRIGSVSNDAPLTIGSKPDNVGDDFKGLVDEVTVAIG